MNDSNKDTLIVIFHRNLSDTHRGQGVYLRRLIYLLNQYFNTYVIDPTGFHKFILSDERSNLDSSFFTDFKKTFLAFFRWLITERRKKNSIVISEDLYISIFVVPICILFKIQIIYRSSDFGLEYRGNLFRQMGIKLKPLPFVMNLAETFICKVSSRIIVPSSDVRNLMIKYGITGEKIDIYPHKSYKSVFPPEDIQRFKQENGLLNKTVIAFIGNMDYTPNLEAAYFVIKLAAKHVERLQDSKVIYVIAGRKSYFLKNYSTDFLRVLGEINDIGILLNASDIGLNPSLVPGGASIKIIEYLVNGLLVVSTREGSNGIIPNDRMIVCSREEFLERIKNLVELIRNGSFKRDPVPAEITDYYSTDKWGIEIAKKLQQLKQQKR